MKQRLPDNLSGSWGVTLSQVATKFARKCVPSWDTFILVRIRNSRQLVGDFLTAHGKVGPSWLNFFRHQSGATSGQVVLKLRIREGDQLLLKLNRSEWWSSWSPFYGGREPTSGHHDQKLLVTMMVTVSGYALWPSWPQVTWIWNFRPWWAEVNNVDQVGPHYSHL